jgi:hypothetical protein
VDVVAPLLNDVLVPAVGFLGLIGNVDDAISDGLFVTVPSLSVPDVVSIAPAATTAPPDNAPVTTVAVTVPSASVPPTSVPTVTVGPVTLPPVTVPPVTLAPTTLPQVTLPAVTLPPVTLPPVTVTIPPIVPTTLLDLLDQG